MENNVIMRLNDYPADRYNVLVPVTTMQAASNLQRITVSEVLLDARQDTENKGPSKDIYYEKSSYKYAITKVGGMKLSAAANISIVSTVPGRTETCQRCIEMARATGKARACGTCPHVYDVAVTVTIRVPEPAGGFRLMQATKEIDCDLSRKSMTEAQFNRFLPHRTAMAESKAFMRAIRAALGLAGGYDMQDLQKPFIVARIVPNLDAPEIRDAVANNYLQSMGLLFEMPAPTPQPPALAAPASLPPSSGPAVPPQPPQNGPQAPENVPPYEDENSWAAQMDEAGGTLPWDEAPDEPTEWDRPGIFCDECRREITETRSRNGKTWTPEAIAGYSRKTFGGRCLCTACQEKYRGGRR